MAKSKPDWRPDWRDPRAYPNPASAPPRRWAWEFLRRNTDYQRYARIAAEIMSRNSSGTWDNDDFQDYWAICFNFGLSRYCPDPSQHYKDFEDLHQNVRFDADELIKVQHYSPNGHPRLPMWPSNVNEVTIKFDLNMPIETQIADAKRTLQWQADYLGQIRKIKPYAKRARPDKYPLYLRALDAVHAKADTGLMVAAFFPGQDDDASTGFGASRRLRETLETAERLRDHDYRLIPLSRK